ncbi:S1 family peptidase [Aldersonia kunmingensis]|uniref:S1 family peptidase n=1 Tax=Aldersonia kunmingensis TaxID=408066 RepID=UPI0008303376|nr:S1 family peptidase [Aldersonia kunmingensis]
MARSIARPVAALGTVVLLALGAGAVAHAAPDSEVSDQAPHLPIELVQAIEHDLALSPDEYLERAELAQKLAEFAKIAEQQHPAAFAGSWLDRDGRATIGLAPGPQLAAARAAVQKQGFAVAEVAKSSATLQAEKKSLADWFASQPAEIASLVRGIAVDTLNNTLSVQVAAIPGIQLPGFVNPAHVFVVPAAAAPQPAPIPLVDAALTPPGALAGGDGFIASTGEVALRCSLGFNSIDGRGQPVNITAGHCNPDLGTAGTPAAAALYELGQLDRQGPLIGTFGRSNLEGHDWSIVTPDPGARGRFQNNGIRVPGAAPLGIDGVATPVVGAPVCKAGSRTGFSCGNVIAVDQDVLVGEHKLVDGFASSICALPGDSGGAVVTGRRALGVSSASSVADFPICEIPNIIGIVTGDRPILFATPITAILADNPGVRVRTN